MQVKALEVRDVATFIPVLAFRIKGENPKQRYLVARCGYLRGAAAVAVIKLTTQKLALDAYEWGTETRTMFEAHRYIATHFDELKDGDVIDIQYILGETPAPKVSESEEKF